MATTSKRSGKWWLVIGLLVLLTASAIATAVYLLTVGRDSAQATANTVEASAPAPAPIFVKLDPFTVNLQADEYGRQLLYIGLTLRVESEQSQDLLVEHMPQVRSRLLMLLSEQTAQELTTPGGKTALADQIQARIEDPLTSPQPELAIREVLFTEFIVQ